VRRVACRVLSKRNRTVGFYLPTGPEPALNTEGGR
jgi:hypothetical protein